MEKISFSNLLDKQGLSKDILSNIARETGLIERERLITATDLLFAICIEASGGTVSYNDIAAQIETGGGESVSKQAVWKKVNISCLDYFKKVLESLIFNKIDKTEIAKLRVTCRYKRILVQDSTIISLPERLFYFFSGVANQSTKLCNARIQGVYDILNEQFISFSIDKYSKNDLKAAPELTLEQGDLSLRDRGYLINDEIQRHINAGADCIYRYKNKMCLLDTVTEKPLNLLATLKNKSFLDLKVKLNNKDKTVVRLVAIPVTEEIANKRRMKAKKEKKTPPSTEYLKLLSWSIYLTTILVEQANYKEISKLYYLRWRIEIIFKSWKSNMNFDEIHNVSQIQLLVILTARFIMILICTQFIFRPCKAIVKKIFNKNLSLLKVTHYLLRHTSKIIEIILELSEYPFQKTETMKSLARYCSYDRRKRINFEQDMNTLFPLS